MAQYSDSALRGWRRNGLIRKPGAKEATTARTLSEGLQQRGLGSLLLERRESGTVEIYLVWRAGGSQKRTKLGALFELGPDGSERGISYWRAQAGQVAAEVREHGGLEARARHQAQAAILAARLEAEEASRGSFANLFRDYIEDRRGKVRDDQVVQFERILRVDFGRFPGILELPAKAVEPSHIKQILEPIWTRGARRQAAKVRSFLRAAFAFGLRAEHSLGRTSGRSFGLTQNPVDVVTVIDESVPGRRALNEKELAHFWATIEFTKGIGPVLAKLLKFVIATGGQRVEQLMRETWSSFDEKEKTLRLIDSKGRGSVKKIHLIPLSETALRLLKEVKAINPSSDWPWSATGRGPITISSPYHAVIKWLETHGRLDGMHMQRFSPRDLRRTCSQVMQRAGIDDRASDILQSHGITGVVERHYRNDPAGYLPTKRAALDAFDAELQRILATNTAER